MCLSRSGGVDVSDGRETAVRNVSIKHTPVGLHIAKGCFDNLIVKIDRLSGFNHLFYTKGNIFYFIRSLFVWMF